MAPRLLRVRLRDIREEIAGIRDLTKDASQERFAASWRMKRGATRASDCRGSR
jgi:hypothetical protein